MKNEKQTTNVADKIVKLQKTITGIKLTGDKELMPILKEMAECMNDMAKELKMLKKDASNTSEQIGDIELRLEEIEEYLDGEEDGEDGEDGEDMVSVVNCPYCDHEIELDDEFLAQEELVLICTSCKQQIHFITESCGCADEDCDCSDNCECESEEDACGCGCECEEDACGCGHDCECDDEEAPKVEEPKKDKKGKK